MMIEGPCQASASRIAFRVCAWSAPKGNKEDILTSGKRWALKMKALYRDSLMTSKGLDPSVSLEQKAILIVTIRDPQKKGIAYNECILQLRNRNFNHSNLQLTQKLQVSNEE